FARPVLAEREHIAERAKRASVRRARAEGASQVLASLMEQRLRPVGVDPESVEWDAWRRPDGRWSVTTQWRQHNKPRSASWIFDVPARSVSPSDDPARALVEG